MLRAAFEQMKIVLSVVPLVGVDVMNDLITSQASSQLPLHDSPVGEDWLAVRESENWPPAVRSLALLPELESKPTGP